MAQDFDVAYDWFTKDPGAARFGRPGNRNAWVVDSEGNVTQTGDLSIGGALAVTGNQTFTGNLSVSGALSVGGYTTLQSAQTNGDLASFGDVSVVTAGKGLKLKEGADAVMGTAVLVAGVKVVNTAKVTASSRIFLTSQSDGGTVGFVRVSARSAGVSFTITSSSVLDTSTIAWMIVEPS